MYKFQTSEFIKLKKGSYIGNSFESEFRNTLDETDLVIVKFKNKKKYKKGYAVLAKTNLNGGVCDDCLTSFYNEEIIGYNIVKTNVNVRNDRLKVF